MATIDWPATRAFRGAQFTLGLDVSRSGAQGFYTGERQTVSHLADRLRGILTLPPCLAADAGAREALLFGLHSTGDNLRMGMPHRQHPAGTLRGSPTAASSAIAGARSISITGATAHPNVLLGSGFEVDTNADGLADQWALYVSGTTGAVTPSLAAGNGSPYAQRVAATGLGSASGDQMGVRHVADVPVATGQAWVLGADTRDSGMTVRLHVDWYSSFGVLISSSTATHASSGAAWARRSLPVTAPALAVGARLYVWGEAAAGGPIAAAIEIDNLQFEQGTVGTSFAAYPTLSAGDWLGVGGNLLQVAYDGATLSDIGAGVVTLTMPLPAAITSGAAVTWSAPTGLWQIDSEGMQLDYSAPVVQGGVAIPLRQVIA